MRETTLKKLEDLKEIIKNTNGTVVAFSGSMNYTLSEEEKSVENN